MNFFRKLFEQEPTIVPQTISLSTDVVVMEHPSSVEESNKLVQEIHDKVDWFAMYTKEIPNTLLDERLEKIQAIKSETLGYLERRERIGFALNEKQIQEKQQKLTEMKGIDLEIKEIEKEKNERKMLNDLRVKYPQRKFVHMKEINELCKKYGLVLGWTEFYIGELPEENLKQIEAYKKPDEAYAIYEISKRVYNQKTHRHEDEYYFTIHEPVFDYYDSPIIDYSRVFNDVDGVRYQKTKREEVNTFLIACPAKDLLKTITEPIKSIVVQDPIVMFPIGDENIVEIICKWGIEASDPILLNPNNN